MSKKLNILIKLGGKKTKVKNFTLTQKMNDNHVFSFSCDARDIGEKDGYIHPDDVYEYLGKDVEIVVEDKNKKGAKFEFHGIALELDLSKANYTYDQLIVRGKCRTKFADDNEAAATFTDMSLGDIATKVMKPIKDLMKFSVNLSPDIDIPYVTQYGENAFEFICRLANKYGLWYFFDGKQLCLTNEPDVNEVNVKLGPSIERFDMNLVAHPINFGKMFYHYEEDEVYLFRGNELDAPKMDKYGEAAVDVAKGLFYNEIQYPEYEVFPAESDLKDFTQHRVDSYAAHMMKIRGESDFPGISVGTKMNILTSKGKTVGSYYVIHVVHNGDDSGQYSNYFEALPVQLNTPLPSRRIHVPKAPQQSAIVKDNADPDKLGRVRVHFHWQDQNEMTPWIRVIYPYAGHGHSYFCPEIDDQVMVGFEMNNPDRPFVMGSLYHGKNAPEHFTEKNTTKAIHTKCGHRILFEDGDDSQISITTKDDKNSLVLKVDGDGEITITTEGIMNFNAKTFNLEGEELNMKMSKTISLEASQDMDLKGANVNMTADQAAIIKGADAVVEGSSSAGLKGAQVAIDGSAMTAITGGMITLN